MPGLPYCSGGSFLRLFLLHARGDDGDGDAGDKGDDGGKEDAVQGKESLLRVDQYVHAEFHFQHQKVIEGEHIAGIGEDVEEAQAEQGCQGEHDDARDQPGDHPARKVHAVHGKVDEQGDERQQRARRAARL